MSALILGVAGSARAQAPAADRPISAPATAAPPAWHQLVLTVGGALLHASDVNESSAERGRLLLDAGYRPLSWVEVAARYGDSVGPWDYVSSHPALSGGVDKIHAIENLHTFDLGVRADIVSAIAERPLPYHVWPYVGLGWLVLRSQVFASQSFGAGIGLGLGYDVDPRTSFDASFYSMRGFDNGSSGDTVYGAVDGIEAWTAGVSLGANEWTRLRIAYVGEALDRAHTTRESHGALFTFQVSLL